MDNLTEFASETQRRYPTSDVLDIKNAASRRILDYFLTQSDGLCNTESNSSGMNAPENSQEDELHYQDSTKPRSILRSESSEKKEKKRVVFNIEANQEKLFKRGQSICEEFLEEETKDCSYNESDVVFEDEDTEYSYNESEGVFDELLSKQSLEDQRMEESHQAKLSLHKSKTCESLADYFGNR